MPAPAALSGAAPAGPRYNPAPREDRVRALGIVSGLTAAGIWGGMYVVSKVVLEVIPPFTLVSARLLLGAAGLAALVLARGGLRAGRAQVVRVLAVGLVGYGVSLGLQFIGTKLSTAANASLVTTASPAFIFLFGVLLLHERPTWPGLGGLALASLGVIAVINPRHADLGSDLLWGNLSLLGASVTWGLYSVLVKVVSREVSTLEVSLLAFVGGLPLTLPAAGFELHSAGVGPITPGIVLGVLYLGLVSTALAMYLWNKSLAVLEASLVSVLFFAQPVVGAALGATLLGERLSSGFWLGALLIGSGLLLAAGAPAKWRLAHAAVERGDVG